MSVMARSVAASVRPTASPPAYAAGPVAKVSVADSFLTRARDPGHLHPLAGVVALDDRGERCGRCDGLAAELGDHVALGQAGGDGRLPVDDAGDVGAGGCGGAGCGCGAGCPETEPTECAGGRCCGACARDLDTEKGGLADVDGCRCLAGHDLLGQCDRLVDGDGVALAGGCLPCWVRKEKPPAPPTPSEAAVSMATTLPKRLTSGPPESPGWMSQLVSMRSVSFSEVPSPASLAVIDWPSAVTEPPATLGVPPTPPALPMPITPSPPSTELEESADGSTVLQSRRALELEYADVLRYGRSRPRWRS